MLNPNLFKTFLCAVEEGSLSAAAERLDLRQPTISIQVQSLEEYIGAKLLVRKGKGMGLTPEGEVVVRKGRELLNYLERLEGDMLQEIAGMKSQIRIGAGPIMTDHLLPHVVAQFRTDYPDMDVMVEPNETEEIIKGILDLTYDIGFLGYPIENSKLILEEWASNELILIVSPQHKFASRSSLDPKELIGQKFIWRTQVSGIKMFVKEQLQMAKIDIAIEDAYEMPSTIALVNSVQAGLGISVMPRYAVQYAIDLGMIRTLPIDGMTFTRKLYIANHRLRSTPAVAAFIQSAKKFSSQIF